MYRGDRLGYTSHIAGLRKLIDLRGGIQALGLGGTLQDCVRR